MRNSNVVPLIVAVSMASLKTARTGAVDDTSLALFAGTVLVTVGAVVSAGPASSKTTSTQ